MRIEKGSVTPCGWRGSTTFNPSITSYDLLAERILRSLGSPNVVIEADCAQIYDAIDQAVEWYSKYAGFTEEYLLFDSRWYVQGLGIKVDDMINITSEFKNQRYREVSQLFCETLPATENVTYTSLTSISTYTDSYLSAGNSSTFYDTTSLSADNFFSFNVVSGVSGVDTVWTGVTSVTADFTSVTTTFSCATYTQILEISSRSDLELFYQSGSARTTVFDTSGNALTSIDSIPVASPPTSAIVTWETSSFTLSSNYNDSSCIVFAVSSAVNSTSAYELTGMTYADLSSFNIETSALPVTSISLEVTETTGDRYNLNWFSLSTSCPNSPHWPG